MTTKTDKNTLKNLWKKPLAGLLGLSILASMSTACFADEKHEQALTEKTTKAFTKEDVDSYGWFIASTEAAILGLDQKELALSYNKEDLKIIRKLSSFFDTKEKRKQMDAISRSQKANEGLTDEDNLMLQNYNEALAELRKMLKQKIKAGEVRSSFEHIEAYDTNGEMMDSISKLYAASQKKKEQAIKTSANEANAAEPIAADKLAEPKEAAESIKAGKMTTEELGD